MFSSLTQMLLNINRPIAPPDDSSKKLEADGRQLAPNHYRMVAEWNAMRANLHVVRRSSSAVVLVYSGAERYTSDEFSLGKGGWC